MALLSPGLAVFIFGLAESSTYGFGAVRSWGPTLAGVLLIAAWFVHSWRTPNPLIDLRTFTHTRAGAAGGTFLLFAISVFGSMLLVPLYYQAVRGRSALARRPAHGARRVRRDDPDAGRRAAHRPLRADVAARHRPAAGGDRAHPVRVRRRPHLLRAPVRRQLRPGPRHGPGDDAQHDRRDAGSPAGRDRPDQHRDEHHPPGRRLGRHRDPVGAAATAITSNLGAIMQQPRARARAESRPSSTCRPARTRRSPRHWRTPSPRRSCGRWCSSSSPSSRRRGWRCRVSAARCARRSASARSLWNRLPAPCRRSPTPADSTSSATGSTPTCSPTAAGAGATPGWSPPAGPRCWSTRSMTSR